MNKVLVDYDHDPADLSPIFIAVTTQAYPAHDAWKPALRDTVNGVKVVWARFPEKPSTFYVWVRDRLGERKVDHRRG